MSQENQKDWVARMVKLSDQRFEFRGEFSLTKSSQFYSNSPEFEAPIL